MACCLEQRKDLRLALFRGKLPLGLVTPTDGASEEDLLGCVEAVNLGHRYVAAAAACGFITSKRRRCVNGADGMLLTQMQRTLTGRRWFWQQGLGEREQRLYLQHASCYCRTAQQNPEPTPFFFFTFRAWSESATQKKQGRSYVTVSYLDNVFPNTYSCKRGQKKVRSVFFFSSFFLLFRKS